MAIKFASKRVNGWNNRYLHQSKVFHALSVRIRNGFTLDQEERKFYDDTKSLIMLMSKMSREAA